MNQLKIHTGKAGGALKVVVYGPEGIGKSTFPIADMYKERLLISLAVFSAAPKKAAMR